MNETAVKIICYALVGLGSLLMVYNIFFYFGFIKRIRSAKSIKCNAFLLYFPFTLLVMFLIGYILVGVLVDPSIFTSLILFGGSIYVFVLLIVIYRIVQRLLDNDTTLRSRYDDLKRNIESLTQSANFTLYVNLTNDLIIERSGKYISDNNWRVDKYSDFLLNLRENLVERISSNDVDLFLPKGLLKCFNEGRTSISEVLLIKWENDYTFVKLSAELVRQPETGSIMAFIVENDYNQEIVNENIINNVLEEQFDLIAYLHGDKYQILTTHEGATLLPPHSSGEYHRYLNDIIKPVIVEENQLELLNSDAILNNLTESKKYEVVISMNDGQTLCYKKYSYYLINEATKYFIMMVSDITKEHQDQIDLNSRLSLALDRAEAATKAKTAFFSNLSHDIRTPMNAIVGYISLAKDEQTIQGIKDYLAKIESSSRHLLSLINDVLDMSRIESGKMELDPIPANIIDMMTVIGDMFSTQMKQKNISFTIDVDDIKNPCVLCDKVRLNRIVINLISNAYKFTKEGGHVALKVSETKCVDGKVYFCISVRDDGIGMSPEFASKVFSGFERERDVKHIQGTGLGLLITKNFVEFMGGTIDVKSEKGQGSEFIINIGFDVCEEKEKDNQRRELDLTKVDFSNVKILLVDDTPINVDLTKLILGKYGFQVQTAENGLIAFETIKNSKEGEYQIILMDAQMPIMDGYEATHEIRNLANPKLANIPIIFLSANAFSEQIQRAFKVGANRHLSKPINVDKLIQTIYTILKEHHYL